MRKMLLVCNIIVAATLSAFCLHKAMQLYSLYCPRIGVSAEELLALTKRLDAICSTCERKLPLNPSVGTSALPNSPCPQI